MIARATQSRPAIYLFAVHETHEIALMKFFHIFSKLKIRKCVNLVSTNCFSNVMKK